MFSLFEIEIYVRQSRMLDYFRYFNSCLNPLIYSIFNAEFRLAFRKILTKYFCCRPANQRYAYGSSSPGIARATTVSIVVNQSSSTANRSPRIQERVQNWFRSNSGKNKKPSLSTTSDEPEKKLKPQISNGGDNSANPVTTKENSGALYLALPTSAPSDNAVTMV